MARKVQKAVKKQAASKAASGASKPVMAVKKASVKVSSQPVQSVKVADKKTAKPSAKSKPASKVKRNGAISKQPVASPVKAIQSTGKTYLNAAELEHYKALLIEKLKELTGDVASIETEALKGSRSDATGDLSSMPIHMADLGTDNFEQEFALGLMDSERKIVSEIIAALRRIQNETYGICEGTGKPIPKVRLEACPWARYCVEYAAKLEKNQSFSIYGDTPRRWASLEESGHDEAEDSTDSRDTDDKDDASDSVVGLYGEEEQEEADDHDPDLDDLYEIDESGAGAAEEEEEKKPL